MGVIYRNGLGYYMNNSETAKEAFDHFVSAFENKLINVEPCKLFNDVFVHIDIPNQTPRFTYVMFDSLNSKKVIAQSVIVFAGMVEGDKKKWQIGWCVDEDHRQKGIGYDLASKALQEFSYNLKKDLEGDYMEANVDEGNIASIRIAEKLIGGEEILARKEPGKKAHSFLKQFKPH